MKVYELSRSYYEDTATWLYFHPEDKTDTDFHTDVVYLLKKYGMEYMDEEEGWIGVDSWVSHIAKRLPELGYIPIDTLSCGFFGGSILKKTDLAWEEVVGSLLFSEALRRNDIIENELNMKIMGRDKGPVARF